MEMDIVTVINKISETLGIPVHIANHRGYAIYSAIARQSLASFWDGVDGEISTKHFKDIIRQLLYAYVVLTKKSSDFSLAKSWHPVDENALYSIADEMLDLFWQTGNIYRKSSDKEHKLGAATFACCTCGKVQFLRGVSVEEQVFMSGSGLYRINNGDVSDEMENVIRFWGLGEPIGSSFLKKLLLGLNWINFNPREDMEYLDVKWQSGPYWKNIRSIDDSGEMALVRYGNPGAKVYAVYRKDGEVFQMAKLPFWRTIHPWGEGVKSDFATKEYYRIACSLLKARNTLPAIKYSYHGEYVFIKLGYLLPTAEENLFRLYSWPNNFEYCNCNPENDFKRLTQRVMMRSVFEAFKTILEFQGFTFLNEVKDNG